MGNRPSIPDHPEFTHLRNEVEEAMVPVRLDRMKERQRILLEFIDLAFEYIQNLEGRVASLEDTRRISQVGERA